MVPAVFAVRRTYLQQVTGFHRKICWHQAAVLPTLTIYLMAGSLGIQMNMALFSDVIWKLTCVLIPITDVAPAKPEANVERITATQLLATIFTVRRVSSGPGPSATFMLADLPYLCRYNHPKVANHHEALAFGKRTRSDTLRPLKFDEIVTGW